MPQFPFRITITILLASHRCHEDPKTEPGSKGLQALRATELPSMCLPRPNYIRASGVLSPPLRPSRACGSKSLSTQRKNRAPFYLQLPSPRCNSGTSQVTMEHKSCWDLSVPIRLHCAFTSMLAPKPSTYMHAQRPWAFSSEPSSLSFPISPLPFPSPSLSIKSALPSLLGHERVGVETGY